MLLKRCKCCQNAANNAADAANNAVGMLLVNSLKIMLMMLGPSASTGSSAPLPVSQNVRQRFSGVFPTAFSSASSSAGSQV